MYDDTALYAEPLTPQQHAGIKHLLRHSALATCAGVTGRIALTTVDGHHALTVAGLGEWRWSSGEHILLGVLLHIAGQTRAPRDTWKLDDRNRRVVSEALTLAIPAGERAGLERLMAAVDGEAAQ